MSHKIIEKLTKAKSLATHKMGICSGGMNMRTTSERYNLWVARHNKQVAIWNKMQHYIHQFAQSY